MTVDGDMAMRSLITSMSVKYALTVALGLGTIGLTACSSPEEDADARGENVEMPTTAQDEVELEAVQPEASVSEGTAGNSTTASTTDTTASNEGSVVISETEAVDNKQLGTHDNDDIADGTDKEEHVSTY